MGNRTNAQAALLTVAQAYFTTQIGGTYPVPADQTRFVNFYPIGAFDAPKVCVYADGGPGVFQGLGYSTQYLDTRFKIEVFGRNYDEAEAMCNWLNTAWTNDMDYSPTADISGQGKLRVSGGIKILNLSEFAATADERFSNAYYRRVATLITTIKE